MSMIANKEIVDYNDWYMAQIQYNDMDTDIQPTTEGLAMCPQQINVPLELEKAPAILGKRE